MHQKFVIVLSFSILLWCITAGPCAYAQVSGSDTVKLSINDAESLFLKNNLQLIIQHYNIDNAQAQIITARLFQNPDFSFSNVLYNPATKRVFDVSKNGGEYTAGISQLFLTAGKRNKNIQLAKIGVQQSQYQFFDLLRTLKLTLRNDFFTVYYLQQSVTVYDQEIQSLATIFKAYKEQYAKGNIAEKEVLRIQSQLYSLQAELTGLQVGMDSTQSQLKLLIRAKPNVYLVPQYSYGLDGKQVLTDVPYHSLLDSAYNNRYDLRLAKLNVDYNKLNLKLQKATAIPDVSVNINYDKQASYIKDYTGVGLDIPLPLFNRNQGAIKQARIAVDQSNFQLQSQQDQVESDVATNYTIASRYEKVYNSFDPQFKGDFTHLVQEVFKNYQKRNISLLEFLDFYDSFKVNAIQLNNIQLSRITSLEQLNYVTGTRFFNK
jgi:cobalt-zinc-cadmium efflux system outer membrane protein